MIIKKLKYSIRKLHDIHLTHNDLSPFKLPQPDDDTTIFKDKNELQLSYL